MPHARFFWDVLRRTVTESLDDKLLRLSAALSYYAIFSLAPLLLIAVSIAGLVFGDDAASGVLAERLAASMGPQAAAAVQAMIATARQPSDNILAATVGIALMLIGSSGVLVQLQDALNTVWGLQAREGQGLRGLIRSRLRSLLVVLGVGLLLLASLTLGTVLDVASRWVADVAPLPPLVWRVLERVVSIVIITLLFATIFRVLPDAQIAWGDVWLGAVAASLLFAVGEFAIGWYLGREATASSYGSAGALVLILLWVNYSSIILLFGAEFTQVHANARGRTIEPNAHAVFSAVPSPA